MDNEILESTGPEIKPIAYTHGLYVGLITIASLIVGYVLNLEKNVVISGVSLAATIMVFVYGIKTYKKQNCNLLTIKEALKVGMAIAAIGGIISAIYIFIHYSFIQPEFVEGIRENAYNEMTKGNQDLSEEQYETAEKMMNIFTSEFFMSTMALIWTLFLGLIISLITGAFMKEER